MRTIAKAVVLLRLEAIAAELEDLKNVSTTGPNVVGGDGYARYFKSADKFQAAIDAVTELLAKP